MRVASWIATSRVSCSGLRSLRIGSEGRTRETSLPARSFKGETCSFSRKYGELKTAPRTGKFPGNSNLPNGITIFPGGFPLYRNGELVGAIGVSGDGVDQDDIVGASGCADFLPAPRIRADSYTYRGARLPYAKFPRDPDM